MKRGKKKQKRILAVTVILALLAGLFPVSAYKAPQVQAAEYGIRNPRTDSDGVTTWDCVYFGNYWQSDTNGDGTADKNDSKTAIKWRVLSVDGGDAFLLADQNLDCQQYNTEWEDTTWATCTLRSWLNGYNASSNQKSIDYSSDNFLDNAFTSAEQAAINPTTVVNDNNPVYSTEGGDDTSDQVYLLSIAEAENADYGFTSSSDNTKTRGAKNTAYAKACGAYTYTGSEDDWGYGNGWWWLRSPGYYSDFAASVDSLGSVDSSGDYVLNDGRAVRPALHLNLQSTSAWSYAGTVSSDGGENSKEAPESGDSDIDAAYETDKKKSQSEGVETIGDFTLTGMDTSFTVPDDVPVIGGGEMKLDFGLVPITVEKEGNQFRAGIGFEAESTTKEGKTETETFLFSDPSTWNTLKKAVEKQKKNLLKGKKILQSAAKSKHGIASTPLSKKVETTVYGYVEGTIDQGTCKSVEGKIVVEISLSASKEWQTFIVSVPVVLKAEAEAGGKFSLELGMDFSKASLYAKGEMELTLPKFRFSGGVGVAYVADVSVYGEAANTIKISGGTSEKASITDTVSGELGVSVKALLFSYEKAVLSGEWQIYPSKKKTKTAATDNGSSDTIVTEEDLSIDRGYEAQTSEWENKEEESGQQSEIQVLQENVYSQAEPKIVSLDDGTKIMIFTKDVGGRTTGNHTAVAYSVYNSSEKTWTEPEIVEDDGTADFYPEIATDGANTYLAWVNTNRNDFTQDSEISEIAKSCEISVARFDSSHKAFVDRTTLTDNEKADVRPSVLVKNGEAYVAWYRNSESDIISLSGTNEIYYAKRQNSAWGKETLYASCEKPVTNVKIGSLSDEIQIAYVEDEDGDASTLTDTVLYLGKLTGEASRAAGDHSAASGSVFTHISGEEALIFTAEDGLWMTKDGQTFECLLNEDSCVMGSYQMIEGKNSDLLISSEPTEKGTNIIGYIIENGIVGSPVPLTDQANYIQSPNGFYDNGSYYLTFTRDKADISETSVNVTTDICSMKFGNYTDVAMEEISVEGDQMTPGGESEVDVTIVNEGLTDLGSHTITISNGETVLGTWEVPEELPAGAETQETVTVQLPEDYEAGTELTCTVQAENDSNSDNDSTTVKAGKPNLVLESFSSGSGSDTSANVYITNASGFDASANLEIRDTDASGKLLKTVEVGEIKAGERQRVKLSSLDLNAIADEGDSLYLGLVCEQEEEYTMDNCAFIMISTTTSEDGGIDSSSTEKNSGTTGTVTSSSSTSPSSNSSSKRKSSRKSSTNASSYRNWSASSSSTVKKPKKVTLKKAKALGKRKVKVIWKWFANQSGFQLQYARNKKFTKGKKVKKYSTYRSNATVKNLKKGKTYYFRVRAYKKSGGKTVYGKWSKVKKGKVR